MKSKLIILSVLLALAGQSIQAQKLSTLRMVTGADGGYYEAMGRDLKEIFEPVKRVNVSEDWEYNYDDSGEVVDSTLEKDSTAASAQIFEMFVSRGSYDNYQRLIANDFDMGFVQYDILRNEFIKEIDARYKRTEQIKLLLPMGYEQIHLIVRKDSDIDTIGDLKNKKVAVGNSLQGTHYTAGILQDALGIEWIPRPIDLEHSIKSFVNNRLDAIIFVGAAPVDIFAMFQRYHIADQVKMLSIPENEKLSKFYGERTVIPASAYEWLDRDIHTYSVSTVLVTSGDFSISETEMLNLFMKTLSTNLKTLKNEDKYHPGWKEVSFKEDPQILWDYHEVAKKYIKKE